MRDLLRPADQAGLAALVVEPEPELGSDHDLVLHRGEGRAGQLLVDVRPGDLSGVEERSPRSTAARMSAIISCRSPGVGAVGLAHPRAAKPDRRDLQVTSEGRLSVVISRLM